MRFDKKERVAGQPILRVRNFLREFARPFVFKTDTLAQWFEVPAPEAARLLREMKARGWVERLEGKFGRQGSHQLTMLGNQVAAWRAIASMSRAKADKLLAEFLARVADVNGRDELTHYVHEVQIFGSYLNRKAKDLGDLDLAVDLRQRQIPGRDQERYLKQRAYQSGRRLTSLFAVLTCGEREVKSLLRVRNPYISMHPMSDITATNARSKSVFKWKGKWVG